MDPLSDTISLLRPKAAVSKPISGRGQWGVRYKAHDAPGFTIVLAGEAWLAFESKTPIQIAKGDFILLPTTPAFALSSQPGAACVPVEPRNEAVRHGEQDGDADFAALGGSFTFDRVNAALLLKLLPDLIHIPASEGRATRFGRFIDLLSEECATDYPGRELRSRPCTAMCVRTGPSLAWPVSRVCPALAFRHGSASCWGAPRSST